jgi:hypothetical protein
MCPALTSIRSDRLAVAQRAVANRALGWRLRVELGGAQSLRSNCSKRNTIDVVRQSPLPGVVPNLTAYVDADVRPRKRGALHESAFFWRDVALKAKIDRCLRILCCGQ